MISTIPVKRAFSLTELLIALGVLAIVAAIIVPKFMGLQTQAQNIAEQSMANDMTKVYADLITTGSSSVTPAPTNTGDALLAMNSDPKFQFPLPYSVVTAIQQADKDSTPLQVVQVGNAVVAFNPATGTFSAVTLPTDGSAVQIGNYVAAVDPSTGKLFSSLIPEMGQVVVLGSNAIVVTDPTTGKIVTGDSSSLSFQGTTTTQSNAVIGNIFSPGGVPNNLTSFNSYMLYNGKLQLYSIASGITAPMQVPLGPDGTMVNFYSAAQTQTLNVVWNWPTFGTHTTLPPGAQLVYQFNPTN